MKRNMFSRGWLATSLAGLVGRTAVPLPFARFRTAAIVISDVYVSSSLVLL
jgi:uncharacterized membrane protein (DUF485 family)